MVKYAPKLPGLHDAQQNVADSEARWKILCAGRRFGKTRLGVQLCIQTALAGGRACLLYTSPSPRDLSTSRMPSSA